MAKMKQVTSLRTLMIMRGAQHDPRTLRTIGGNPVADQVNGEFDGVTTYARNEPLLCGVYTFSILSDAKAEQRCAQKAGYKTSLKHNLGTASPYRELTISPR